MVRLYRARKKERVRFPAGILFELISDGEILSKQLFSLSLSSSKLYHVPA
jgi:hypothetical protein